jgi:hypothetical protein
MSPIERNDDQQYDSEDEISILDILRFFVDGWKTICSFTLIGTLLGVSYVAIGVPQYKATAIIEPAYVTGFPVESIESLRRKLKSASYYSSETYKACGLEGASKDGDALVDRLLPPTAKKDAALDQIEFTSNSNETNVNCLNSVLEDIHRDHEKLKKSGIDASKDTLEELERRLKEAVRRRDLYDDRIQNMSLGNLNKFPSGILFYQTARAEADSSVGSLASEISAGMRRLSDPQTRPARFITPSYASEVQLDSKRMMKVLAAVFIGFIFSIIYLVGKKYSAKLKKEISKPTPE